MQRIDDEECEFTFDQLLHQPDKDISTKAFQHVRNSLTLEDLMKSPVEFEEMINKRINKIS